MEPRRDPLRGHWTIITEHRAGRPRDVRVVEEVNGDEPCPFCPGNEHLTPPAVVESPPGSWSWRVFPNKYPAVDGERGSHEVLVETPVHEGDVVDHPPEQIQHAWVIARDRLRAMAAMGYAHVVAFKNYGEQGGATLSHPHVQLAGLGEIFPAPRAERRRAERAHRERGVCLTCEAAEQAAVREIGRDGGTTVFAPHAPRFPYEVWIAPAAHEPSFLAATDDGVHAMAAALRRVLLAYRSVLDRAAYNVMLHTAHETETAPFLHWRVEVFPRLGRVAGFELGTGVFLCEVSPETAAAKLREAMA